MADPSSRHGKEVADIPTLNPVIPLLKIILSLGLFVLTSPAQETALREIIPCAEAHYSFGTAVDAEGCGSIIRRGPGKRFQTQPPTPLQ